MYSKNPTSFSIFADNVFFYRCFGLRKQEFSLELKLGNNELVSLTKEWNNTKKITSEALAGTGNCIFTTLIVFSGS